jgi:WD40 repeat protein
MRPPWPNTTLTVGGTAGSAVAFSPCKSFLACSSFEPNVVRVWDRHGELAQLEGHTGEIACLQYSFDGKYLASGSRDKSIWLRRIIASVSAADSSPADESINRGSSRGTLQAQSDIILLGHGGGITALAFSPTDSNLLASGCVVGEIKFWDVINQVCIHAFNPQLSRINNIFFSPGDNIQCYVATRRGPMIRIVRNKRMEFATTMLEELSLRKCQRVAFSPCGTFFAAISERTRIGGRQELALFDLRTMAKTQSVVVSGGPGLRSGFHVIAMSPDSKQVAIVKGSGETRIFECHDLTIQKYVDNLQQRSDETVQIWSVAVDPTSQCFAVGCIADGDGDDGDDGKVVLQNL